MSNSFQPISAKGSKGDLIIQAGICHCPVCPLSVSFTVLDLNVSVTSSPVWLKFYLADQWVGGLTALGFGQVFIRTVVSMVTKMFHRLLNGKPMSPLSQPFLTQSSSNLQLFRRGIQSIWSLNFGQMGQMAKESLALEHKYK